MRARRCGLIAIVALSLGPAAWAGQTVYVDDDAKAGGDGLSWTTALNDLQAALSIAGDPKNGISEVHMAGGVYRPTLRTDAEDPRTATFQLQSGLKIMGGYAGPAVDPANPDARDVDLYVTSLSGDLAGDDIPPTFPGEFINYQENAYHVVTAKGVDDTAVLEGLTITAGSACCEFDQFDPRSFGGGLHSIGGSASFIHCTFSSNQGGRGGGAYLDNGEPIFIECTFANNRASTTNQEGGGMYSQAANPTLNGCNFTQNIAWRGGGIYHRDGAATLTDCVFTENQSVGSSGGGGGIRAINSTISLRNCAFNGNTAENAGGGIVVLASDEVQVTIENCAFTGNTARSGGALHGGGTSSTLIVSNSTFHNNLADDFDGGAMNISYATVTITACEFKSSAAVGFGGALDVQNLGANSVIADCQFDDNLCYAIWGAGGAMAIYGEQPLTVSRCVFSNNYSNDDSGVFAIFGATATTFVNCLFRDNSAWSDGGVFDDIGSGATLVNCTLVGNSAQHGGAIHNPHAVNTLALDNCILWGNSPNHIEGNGVTTLNSCNIQGGWTGPGANNIAVDPLFADPSAGDYAIAPGSPCIDAGDNSRLPRNPDQASTDLAGEPRFRDDPQTEDTGFGPPPMTDIGCYEFQPPANSCPADCAVPHDGVVEYADLLAVVSAWGTGGAGGEGVAADVNADGIVNVHDLLEVIHNWGACP
ncbi:MAG: right-handed parallel beta-helix repeat-containing protein [Phycisphaerales bacterium]|nr:right-handed parallel beta-helix repeat-containing protein [Phycisphaerales bacterium]